MIGVLLVDDHPVFLDGLTACLADADGIDVVARATTRAEARRALEHHVVDVALLDLRLPDGSGLGLIAPEHPAPTVGWIVLTAFGSDDYRAAAIRRGALGFIDKTAPGPAIIEAVRQAASGRVDRGSVVLHEPEPPRARPTRRDLAVIRSLGAGLSNDEIGVDLGIATKTVEGRLSRIFRRLGVANRTELVLRACREGWLDGPDPLE